MKAHLRRVRITPKKMNLVAGMVRGKKVTEALELLDVIPKKAAGLLYDVIHSAASNAVHNFHQSMNDLAITSLVVTKGPSIKRFRPVSRGRSHPILKYTSHITVEVGVVHQETEKTAQKPVAKKTVKTVKSKKS